MPGRTPSEAFQAFVEPLGGAIACVLTGKLSASKDGRHVVDQVHYLQLNAGEAVRVGGPHHLRLGVRMKYRIIRDDDLAPGPFKISTRAYSYTVTNESGAGILSYHWHPDGESHVQHPHLHVGAASVESGAIITAKQHLPTGRIALEQVIRTLIAELGVPARIGDWRERLDLTQGIFELYRSWR